MIYLASQSPRRKDLLREHGWKFRVVPSMYKEEPFRGVSGEQTAVRHALGKCLGAAGKFKRGFILGADTLISFRGRVIGKPRNRAEGRRMLSGFSGATHTVITAVAVADLAKGTIHLLMDKSNVTFRKLNGEAIDRYLDTGEYADKAGAYGYQEIGRALVKSVKGSESNVIGLPMTKLNRLLRRLNSRA